MSKKKKPRPKKSGKPTPKSQYEMSLKFSENESIRIGFSGYDRGATVIKTMFEISSPHIIERTAIEFLKQGDESVLEILRELAAALPDSANSPAERDPAS